MSCPEIGLHNISGKMDKRTKVRIRYEREENGLSYRKLAEKYGIAHMTIYAMLNPKRKKPQKAGKGKGEKHMVGAALPEDVKALQEQLREARLIIELQDNMINIASKELGVDLRKKRDTKQSR